MTQGPPRRWASSILIGHLTLDDATDLLHAPTPAFPSDLIPRDVARAAAERTGGQPALTQLFGQLIVDHINELREKGEARGATLADLALVEPRVITQLENYLSHLARQSPPDVQAFLRAEAEGRDEALVGDARRWLRHRGLLDEAGHVNCPILLRYVREYV